MGLEVYTKKLIRTQSIHCLSREVLIHTIAASRTDTPPERGVYHIYPTITCWINTLAAKRVLGYDSKKHCRDIGNYAVLVWHISPANVPVDPSIFCVLQIHYTNDGSPR